MRYARQELADAAQVQPAIMSLVNPHALEVIMVVDIHVENSHAQQIHHHLHRFVLPASTTIKSLE